MKETPSTYWHYIDSAAKLIELELLILNHHMRNNCKLEVYSFFQYPYIYHLVLFHIIGYNILILFQ